MNLLDIFTDIKNAFGGLWQTKQRGNSLEIITPYATTNNRYPSKGMILLFLMVVG